MPYRSGYLHFDAVKLTEVRSPERLTTELSKELINAVLRPDYLRDMLEDLLYDSAELGFDSIRECVEAILDQEGFPGADTSWWVRSGIFGEVIVSRTMREVYNYNEPIRKLRHRERIDSPGQLMDLCLVEEHDDDDDTIHFIEVKTRYSSQNVEIIQEALDDVKSRDDTPEIFSFICKRLYESNRIEEANKFNKYQYRKNYNYVRHAVAIVDSKHWQEGFILHINNNNEEDFLEDTICHAFIIDSLEDKVKESYCIAYRVAENIYG